MKISFMTQSNRRQAWILAILLMAFAALFVWRGPMRALAQSADLAHLYAASVLWIEGGSPYDGEQCVDALQRAGHGNPSHVANGSFYPPPTIAALAPLGLAGWELAKLIWLLMNLLAATVVVWALANWLKIESSPVRWLVAALLVVIWGPAATTLSLGQLSLVSAACAFAGLVLADRGKSWSPGVLIAMACLIKPQLGLGFFLLIALRREWRATALALGLMMVVSAVGIGRLMMTTPDWASQLASNLTSNQSPGQMLDSSLHSPMRFQMIDLRPILHLVLPDGLINLAALLIVALLAGLAIVKLFRIGLKEHTLLAVSGVGLLLLMPVYHRYYDAVLLLPLLVLAVNTLACHRYDWLMLVIALSMLPLVFPLPAMLSVMHQKAVVSDALAQSWAWRHLLLQIHSWVLLVAALALVAWTLRKPEGLADCSKQASASEPNTAP